MPQPPKQFTLNQSAAAHAIRPLLNRYHASDVPREPFTPISWRTSSVKRCGGCARNRPMKHLDRIGASNHELYRVIRDASNAEHALRVLALYEGIDAGKRAKEKVELLTMTPCAPVC